jgi:hypothetical protein
VTRSIKYTAVAALAISAVAVLPAGVSPAAAAAEPTASPTTAASATQENARPLIEMITADKRGRFYTLNSAEAATAERVNGFTRTDESRGISMFDRNIKGTVAVHRLRLRSGHQAYLLATSRDEIKKLSDPSDSKRQFDDEGVLGYVYQKAQGDGTFKLVRYTKNGDWRASVENRADLIDAGFRVDGPLGYVPAS